MNKEKRLQAWSECVTRFLGLNIGESEASVELSCGSEHIILRFPAGSLESERLRRELSSCKPGTKIGILKTDEASKPLLIRLLGKNEGAKAGVIP